MKIRTIDTNILVRCFVRDDSRQWHAAAEIFKTSRVVILSTVLLETEWVLRRSFGLPRADIVFIFRSLLSSENAIFVERESVVSAVSCFEAGMDFADALHVCLTDDGETFVTFDRELVKLANKHIDTVSVELAS